MVSMYIVCVFFFIEARHSDTDVKGEGCVYVK